MDQIEKIADLMKKWPSKRPHEGLVFVKGHEEEAAKIILRRSCEHLPDSHADFRDELLTLHVNLSGFNPLLRLSNRCEGFCCLRVAVTAYLSLIAALSHADICHVFISKLWRMCGNAVWRQT